MRNLLLGLCCLGFASPAWAQNAPFLPQPRDPYIQPINHLVRGPACHDDCPQKSCVAVPTTIKHTHTVFGCKCVEYCLPKCTLSRGCNSCADNCGPVRTKNVLLMKRITEECPGTKCEVSHAPGCAPAGGPRFGIFQGSRQGGAVAPPYEVIPTAPTPKK